MEVIGIHHVALNVHDLDEALRFYVDVLGFEALDRPDFGFPGAWLQAGAQQIHLVESTTATIDPRQHVALCIASFEEAVARLETHGVRVAKLAHVPGAGRQAFIADPSGNRIELNQPDRG